MLENIKPLGERVLVKRIKNKEKTDSGLYIPDSAQEKGQIGVVVAVGARIDKEGHETPLQVKVHDKVFFSPYAGVNADDDHLLIKVDELLGVVVEK